MISKLLNELADASDDEAQRVAETSRPSGTRCTRRSDKLSRITARTFLTTLYWRSPAVSIWI